MTFRSIAFTFLQIFSYLTYRFPDPKIGISTENFNYLIIRLSDPEIGIGEENFKMIMKYIIGLIEKDKLLESLVEKLCHRSLMLSFPSLGKARGVYISV